MFESLQTQDSVSNVYASGLAATGVKCVLVSTMMNAYAVANLILRDTLPRSELRDQLIAMN